MARKLGRTHGLAASLLVAGLLVANLPAGAAEPRGAAGPHPGLEAMARNAATELQKRYPGADVAWNAGQVGVAVVAGLQVETAGRTPEERARGFLQAWPGLLGVPVSDLTLLRVDRIRNRTYVRFSQTVATPAGRLPVLDRLVAVTLDEGLRVRALSSDALPATGAQAAVVTAEVARDTAVRAVLELRPEAPTPAVAATAHSAVLATPQGTRTVWAVDVRLSPVDRRAVVVDARSGAVLSQRSVVLH